MYFFGTMSDKKYSIRNCPFLRVLQIAFEAFFVKSRIPSLEWL